MHTNIITEAQAIKILKDRFNLVPPVDFNVLKDLYRKMSKELHPDIAGGSEEAFKDLLSDFTSLKEFCEAGSVIFNPNDHKLANIVKTADGTPLSELGRGLKSTENGYECEVCEHRGYRIEKFYGFKRCECKECGGSGVKAKEFPCPPCKGTGKFRQLNGRIVDCRVCKGTGKFKHPVFKTLCTFCWGNGIGTEKIVAETYAVKCHKCEGRGWVKIYNPVLPKGRLLVLNNPEEE